MQHSSSQRTPITFRGFGLCVAAIVIGYVGLIGFLGVGIKHSLDHPAVAVASTPKPSPIEANVSAPVINAPVIKANASD